VSLARSFIKGGRWAFHHKEKLMACEACVFGSGKHTCGRPGGARQHGYLVPAEYNKTGLCVLCGKPEGHAIHIR
jgi:hypothetical protein